jgi:hypothetical protein
LPRCASQLLDRDAQATALGAATLSQQEKKDSADVQRNGVIITGFISPSHKRTEGRGPLRGSEFTTKVAHYMGIQQKSLLG